LSVIIIVFVELRHASLTACTTHVLNARARGTPNTTPGKWLPIETFMAIVKCVYDNAYGTGFFFFFFFFYSFEHG
jgi:hypothetical protein